MRLLVDTNVFLDLVLKRGDECKYALEFFIWCRQKRKQTLITSLSFRDIEYVAMKNLHDRSAVNKILGYVYSICSKVVGVSADSAITSIFENYKDYEDELIVQTAKEEMADAIITNNKKDFDNRGIPVFSPKEIQEQCKV